MVEERFETVTIQGDDQSYQECLAEEQGGSESEDDSDSDDFDDESEQDEEFDNGGKPVKKDKTLKDKDAKDKIDLNEEKVKEEKPAKVVDVKDTRLRQL